ncbi:hypothetical protein [Chelativorans sp. AA-79]|uniref:hypothetical protein n=1 Tax=Chelativorans sp. AA-79 TaxID=3028735 RepID=UPI0023F863F6|nr:hypothetical protein [Chelativorans sp. AA-79]WEX10448.1 hypothetical protein PVE73_05680 [Chelativorans sp. AA-79]
MRTERGLKIVPVILLALSASGCGMGGMASAVRTTGESFDRAECMARDAKGESLCETPAPDQR